jgi:hypothetical protein
MTHFVYKKDNGETSERDVVPIGFKFGDRDTVLCIDLTNSENKDSDMTLLEEMRTKFINELYEAGFSRDIRSFHIDGIQK